LIASVLFGAESVIAWPFDATMIGQTLDHYRILAQIGEGGMGVVYRARDEELNRDVALRLLAHGALEKVGPGHLLREAQTASSLTHPNICTIHQVGHRFPDNLTRRGLSPSGDR